MTHKDAKRNTVNDAEQFPQSSKPTLRKNGENENFDKFQPVFIENFPSNNLISSDSADSEVERSNSKN